MKRKRGHKKGNKSKKSKSSTTEQENLNESAENQTSEHSSGASAECENSEHESKLEVDAPPSSTASGSSPIVNVDPVASADNNKVFGRVKVKLKNSKAPEPYVPPCNDVDKKSNDIDKKSNDIDKKSNDIDKNTNDIDKNTNDIDKKSNDIDKKSTPQPHVEEPEKPVVVAIEKKEEPVPRLPDRKPVFLNVYRKMKGIKIKSLKPVDGSSSVTEKKAEAVDVVKAPEAIVVQKDTKPPDEVSQANKKEPEITPISVQSEQKKTDQSSQYNKQELEESLTVIKKIMNMDAADPFNVPVDPEALGIPDYFDIIKTPMDFGTICSNFEKGNIYMNSADVYKDVQYIWNNCSKYNKKGDYIVDLMKRVKKNFMKYWASAGLYIEQSSAENAQLEDGGKASTKSSQSKHKSHKRHGRHHKSDCMCAVCILKRRKREREGSQVHSGAQEVINFVLSINLKYFFLFLKESSPVGSPSVDNSSINMGEEQDTDVVDVVNKTGQRKTEIVEPDSPVAKRQRVSENKQEAEEEEILEVESEDKTKANIEDETQSVDKVMKESIDEPVTSAVEKLAVSEDLKLTQTEEEEKEKRLREQKELARKEWRAKMNEKFQVRNPRLLSLCETIFPDNNNNLSSVWNGPNSLFNGKRGSNRSGSLHKAVEALMKQ
ncbi:unnamed protein product [Cochlearia groenlandica]